MNINIKKHLLKTLKVEEILNLTGDKKVYFIHANNPKVPYVEYEVISESGNEYYEGTEKYTEYLVQVDIFSHSDYSELEDTIKNKMIAAGYSRDQAIDLYENKTELLHKAMRFNISLPY
ncbi:MAG: prohead protease [Clostridium sp.]|uniref:prohead protease n=1 Tax=Clostridium sp. TaxID=1506 RepID=UPI003F2BF8F8